MFTICLVISRKLMVRENWLGFMFIFWYIKLFWLRKVVSGRILCMLRLKYYWSFLDMFVILSISIFKKYDLLWMIFFLLVLCSRFSGYFWRWIVLCFVGRREIIRFVWYRGWCVLRWFKLEGVGIIFFR